MKKYLGFIVILTIISAIFFWIRPEYYFLGNRDQDEIKSEAESDATVKSLSRRESEIFNSKFSKLVSPKADNAVKVSKTNSEILKTDDLCVFKNLEYRENADAGIKNGRSEQIKKLYFDQSTFGKNYDDYSRFLAGEKPLTDLYTRLLYHLDQAGLVGRETNYKSKIQVNSDEAIQGFHDLENQDSENSVFAILSLAVDNQSQDDRNRWIEKVMSSEKFNSYAIDYRLELERAAELSAISYVFITAYLGQLQIPDWIKIRTQLQKNLFDRPDVTKKIGSLMTNPALETKTPSWAIGFDPLEYEIGRRLIGKPYKIPNFKQLDNSRYKPNYEFDLTILGRVTEHCTESDTQKVREFYADVRRQFKMANPLY